VLARIRALPHFILAFPQQETPVTRLLLVRHAQNDWVRTGKLAGRTPGVHLNEEGQRQAEALGQRLADKKIAAIYSSPLERAVETAEAIARHHSAISVQLEEGILEADFGQWAGQGLRKLSRTRLWGVVQHTPSAAQFPQGETIRAMQMRAVDALERIAASHSGSVVVVSHADVLKAVVAHYAGMHLDLFQRIDIAPASISVVDLSYYGPRFVRLNDTCHYDYTLSPRDSK
jgi:probable phosphomutase (TIGR03848 family)